MDRMDRMDRMDKMRMDKMRMDKMRMDKMRVDKMHIMRLMVVLGLLMTAGGLGAQETFTVRDQVDLPLAVGMDMGQDLFVDSYETWTIRPYRNALGKKVDSFRILDRAAPERDELILPSAFTATVTYEFELADPQTREKTHLLESFVLLVGNASSLAGRYNLKEQLLSVRFREQWAYHPETRTLEKKVLELQPVIWQRRQTEEGFPIDDADTGLPVYFKLELDPIFLRNL
jgi:hypothetical protein